jgi:lipopolysaccharide/colanic/teichoic acid biosynthesis glycosyltransferase
MEAVKIGREGNRAMYRSLGGREVVTEKVQNRPQRAAALSRPRTLRDVYPRAQFDAVLHHERNRADRDETEFSLVLIKMRKGDWRTSCRLARSVLQRARNTDELGWYGQSCLCVLLPSTSAPGARCFEGSIRRLADTLELSVVCKVFTYPSQWFLDSDAKPYAGPRLYRDSSSNGNGNGHSNGNGHGKTNGNGHANGNGHRHNGNGVGMSLNKPLAQGDLMPYVLSGLIDGLEAEAVGLEAVENLLIRKLPCWKRAIDIAVAGMALGMLAPFLALIAMTIKLTSPGPVLFGQWRAGLGGKPFWILKFRTMVTDAEALKASLRKHSEQDGPAFKMVHDPRITRIGKLLRTTSLDELPQLWNVLKGDMSLVGPRPLPLDESAACKQWQRRRLDLTPGLTCIWQVKGRSRVTFVEWMRMDLAYVRSRTLLHDIKLIVMTIPAVLLRKGAR